MRRPRVLCLGILALFSLCSPSFARTAPQGETPEERYGFLVGLCDEQEWELAAREARAFLSEFPRHEKAELARYRMATALFELGRKDQAREAYAELAKREGFEFRAEVCFRLGQCELALDRPAQAAAAFERVRAIPKSYLALAAEFFLGEARFAQGDFAGAEQSYSRVLAAPGGQEYARDARYGLVWCAFRNARHDDVVQRVDEFLRRHADDADAGEMRYLQGEAHLAAGRAREALECFGSVRGGAHAERALRGAAFAHVALGDRRAAASGFERVLAAFPQGDFASEARLHLGIERVRAGDSKSALEPLRASAQDPEGGYWLARALLDTHAAEEALSAVDDALARRPADPLAERLNILRGDVLSELGRVEDAARSYAKAQSDYAVYAAALAAFNAGKLEDAGRSARALLEKFPASEHGPEMRIVLGEVALAAQHFDEAEPLFLLACESARQPALAARAQSRAAWCRFLRGDASGAAELFSKLLELHRESEEAREARYMLGRCLERQGDLVGAIRAWRQSVEADPAGAHTADALLGLMRLDADNAAQWSERLVREFPDAPAVVGALFDLAERAAKQGLRDQAQRGYSEVIARFPEHELADRARYGLAWCAYEAGDVQAAARTLSELTARANLAPELARPALELLVWALEKCGDKDGVVAAHRRFVRAGGEPRKLLGTARLAGAALSEGGRAAEAQSVYDEVLARARGARDVQAEVLIESAWLALHAKHADDAEAAARTAWKLGPSEAARPALAEATFFVGELRFEAGDDERALELYELALAHGAAQVQAQALYKKGFALLRRERTADALPCFARLVEEHPRHELAGESLYMLGDCYVRTSQFERALAPLERLVREQGKHASVPKALFRLGRAHGELGHWKECEAALAELARRAPSFEQAAEADVWRGRAAVGRGDSRAARAAFERVLAVDRGLPAARARLELGLLSSADGQHEDALAQFLKVALLYESGDVVAEATYLAGGALEALEQVEKARARYREVLEKYPKSPFAARAKERLDALQR